MRIDDLNRSPQPHPAEKSEPPAEKQPADSVAPVAADRAEISDLARALTAADPQRLEQLKLEVQSGRYNVSAAEVAKAIIDAHSRE